MPSAMQGSLDGVFGHTMPAQSIGALLRKSDSFVDTKIVHEHEIQYENEV